MAPKKREAKEEEVVRLGPQVADGELVFGIVNSKKVSIFLKSYFLIFFESVHVSLVRIIQRYLCPRD